MRKNILILAVLAIFTLLGSQAHATTWIDLALSNPGAESGDLSGWTTSGPVYATKSQLQSTGTVLPHSGEWFFSTAKTQGTLASMLQYVDLSSYSAGIDAGNMLFNTGFWYHNEYRNGSYDVSWGTMYFLDASDNIISSSSSAEMWSTSWALLDAEGYIPAGTRKVGLEMNGKRYDGTFINAFFDDCYFKVGESVVPEPATMALFGIGLFGIGASVKKRRS